nr:hypothetical protein [Xenorhabdus sp. 5]
MQLLFCQGQGGTVDGGGPFEFRVLQPFVPERKPGFIPVEDFEFIPLLVAKEESRGLRRRKLHVQLHPDRQPVDGFSEVDK